MIANCKASGTAARAKQTAQRKTAVRGSTNLAWQRHFLSLLPSIRRHAEVRFRDLDAEAREEMVQETIARALLEYLRLVERDKEHLAYAGSLARYAIAQVRQGRRVGSRMNVRDVSSEYCRRRKGVSLKSLDKFDKKSDEWQEVLVQDRHSTPAEIAAARIDFCEWLKTLPQRTRRLAERLATGETTSSAAQMLGVSPGRISQLRRTLEESWAAFQHESVPALAQR